MPSRPDALRISRSEAVRMGINLLALHEPDYDNDRFLDNFGDDDDG